MYVTAVCTPAVSAVACAYYSVPIPMDARTLASLRALRDPLKLCVLLLMITYRASTIWTSVSARMPPFFRCSMCTSCCKHRAPQHHAVYVGTSFAQHLCMYNDGACGTHADHCDPCGHASLACTDLPSGLCAFTLSATRHAHWSLSLPVSTQGCVQSPAHGIAVTYEAIRALTGQRVRARHPHQRERWRLPYSHSRLR